MKPSLLTFSCLPFLAYAIRLPVQQVKRQSLALSKRGSFGDAQLTDNNDVIYIANVTIAGNDFPVQLDSGSSDLWVSTDQVLGTSSGLTYNMSYGIGYAAGNIARADITFAGVDVPSQAYLQATDVNNPALQYGAKGLLGTGFTSLSGIASQVNQSGASWGQPLFYNIFALNRSEPNFMTYALQRDADPNNVTGAFTIAEYLPQYAGVASTSPIPTFPEQNPSRWTLLIDKVIANGQEVPLQSGVQNAPANKLVGLLDTGTSFIFAPQSIVTAMYSGVPGATFSQPLGKWTVPCDAEVDVSLVIGGRQFDLHPLDTVQPTDPGSSTCIGTWLPQSLAVGKSEFDLLLGDAVLRSLYTVFDFGDFDSNHNLGNPYVRLWSLVDGAAASAEFHQIRGGVANNTFLSNPDVNSASASANAGSGSSSDSSSGSTGTSDISDLESKVDKIMKWAPWALGLAALNAVVLLLALVFTVVSCCRKPNKRAPSGSFIPLPLAGSSAGAQYRPISLQTFPQEEASQPYDNRKYEPSSRYSD